MIAFRTLTHTHPRALHAAFLDAFSTYLVPPNDSFTEFKHLLDRRGVDLNLSVGAFDDDELVGFIINGVGCWGYQPTAYDALTGIRPVHQKKGIARRLFEHLFPLLIQNGIEQYLLEVTQSNSIALRLYERLGFTITREYRCFQTDTPATPRAGTPVCHIAPIDQPDWETLQTFWDAVPSWQNAVDAIERMPAHFIIQGAYVAETCVGYGVIEVDTGDVPQLAVHKNHRRKGIGTALLASLQTVCRQPALKVINVEKDNVALEAFLHARGFNPTIDQYEMIRPL